MERVVSERWGQDRLKCGVFMKEVVSEQWGQDILKCGVFMEEVVSGILIMLVIIGSSSFIHYFSTQVGMGPKGKTLLETF